MVRREDINFMSQGGINVDPSIISLLMRAQTSQLSLDATHQRTVSKASSRTSHTTGEPDGSEIESLECSSSDGGFEAVAVQYGKRLPVGPQPKKKPACMRPQKEWSTLTKKEKEHERLDSKVPSHSSPAEFAAAWKVAADVGRWKGDHPPARALPTGPVKVAGNKTKASTGRSAHGRTVPHVAEEDVPLPKWCIAAANKAPATDARVAEAIQTQTQITPPPGLPPPGIFEEPEAKANALAEQVAKALQEGIFVMAGAPVPKQRKQERTPCPYDMPLKVLLPNMDYDQSLLNPSMPCKKRMPKWSS
jgi:hypothetical protein